MLPQIKSLEFVWVLSIFSFSNNNNNNNNKIHLHTQPFPLFNRILPSLYQTQFCSSFFYFPIFPFFSGLFSSPSKPFSHFFFTTLITITTTTQIIFFINKVIYFRYIHTFNMFSRSKKTQQNR